MSVFSHSPSKYRKVRSDGAPLLDILRWPRLLSHTLYGLSALVATLFVLGRFNPFYIPTVDDSAIVMRYLENFAHGHFFAYNVEDGPVFGISSFLWGIACGFVAWLGLAPQASLMIVSFISCVLLFYTMMLVIEQVCKTVVISVAVFCCVYLSTYFMARSLFIGLETPLNLWLVLMMFYFFFERRAVCFYFTAALCVVSKLDTCLIVGGMATAYLMRDCIEFKNIKRSITQFALFFLLPLLLWIAFATLIFHSPLPQSFLSKYYLRQKAPQTSWFPFFESFLQGTEGPQSVMLAGIVMLSTFIVAGLRRSIFFHSLAFAAATIGTLLLYFFYNPGEKMLWYYPLPELLAVMTAACLPFDSLNIRPRILGWVLSLVTLAVFIAIVHTRLPMNRAAIDQAVYWQSVFERERMESGQLANDVAPKTNPVLWTGHGYPAYLFHGYVADYSGLNTRHIWQAAKAVQNPDPETVSFLNGMGLEYAGLQEKTEYFLIKMYNANVFMKHALFTEKQQKYLHLRLAGSFYTIDLANAPAFRVFVKDDLAPEINQALLLNANTEYKPDALSVIGKAIRVSAPSDSDRIDFGVRSEESEQTVVLKSNDGALLGECVVPPLRSIHVPVAVHACRVDVKIPNGSLDGIVFTRIDGKPLEIFEPSAARPLNTIKEQGQS